MEEHSGGARGCHQALGPVFGRALRALGGHWLWESQEMAVIVVAVLGTFMGAEPCRIWGASIADLCRDGPGRGRGPVEPLLLEPR